MYVSVCVCVYVCVYHYVYYHLPAELVTTLMLSVTKEGVGVANVAILLLKYTGLFYGKLYFRSPPQT